jgi:hypothetical protein
MRTLLITLWILLAVFFGALALIAGAFMLSTKIVPFDWSFYWRSNYTNVVVGSISLVLSALFVVLAQLTRRK